MKESFPNMGTRAVGYGPTGERVRARIAELREERHLTLTQLSERMKDAGRPIAPNGISRIEQGDRRVDVDDLVAFALALEVTPNALLLPPDGDPTDEIPLTDAVSQQFEAVWRWALDNHPARARLFRARRLESSKLASTIAHLGDLLAEANRELDQLRTESDQQGPV